MAGREKLFTVNFEPVNAEAVKHALITIFLTTVTIIPTSKVTIVPTSNYYHSHRSYNRFHHQLLSFPPPVTIYPTASYYLSHRQLPSIPPPVTILPTTVTILPTTVTILSITEPYCIKKSILAGPVGWSQAAMNTFKPQKGFECRPLDECTSHNTSLI